MTEGASVLVITGTSVCSVDMRATAEYVSRFLITFLYLIDNISYEEINVTDMLSDCIDHVKYFISKNERI